MKNIHLKRISSIVMILAMIFTFNSIVLATNGSNSDITMSDISDVEMPEIPLEDGIKDSNIDDESKNEETKDDITEAGEIVVNRLSRKEKRIAELTDKYNDAVYGKVAYYLEVAQKYSLPICFIGIAIGSFNFLIVGNKKLDKKEQGYGWIVGFVIGLVVFNVMPLVFALFVAGR